MALKGHVYYKMRQILLQRVTAISLQNATEGFYKMRQDFVSEIRAVSTKCGDFIINAAVMKNVTVITKCDSTTFRNS